MSPDVATLTFVTQPGASVAATVMPPVRVATLDKAGHPIKTATSVTIALGGNGASTTLSGMLTRNTVNGIATFPDLSIPNPGDGYTLTASGSGAAPTTSSAFTVAPLSVTGVPTQLAFVVSPAAAEARTVMTPAIQVAVLDSAGKTVTSYTGSVTVAFGTNPAGGTLYGGSQVRAIDGIATFADLTIDNAGSGYALTASAPGLSPAHTGPFDITPSHSPALTGRFLTQPHSTQAGVILTPPVQVAVTDSAGNVVTSYSDTVYIRLADNLPLVQGPLGTVKVKAVNGVATFADLWFDRARTNYALLAAPMGSFLGNPTSARFDIEPGPTTSLAFLTVPPLTRPGAAIAEQRVTAVDQWSNSVPAFAGAVTMAIGNNPGGGTLAGRTTVNAVNNVATFSDLSIDKLGNRYTLVATTNGLAPATSGGFDIQLETSAVKLVFTVQPSATRSGGVMTPPVQVAAEDGAGNVVTSYTGTISLDLPPDHELGGTRSVDAVNGVATFTGLIVFGYADVQYVLKAYANGLADASSAPFLITK